MFAEMCRLLIDLFLVGSIVGIILMIKDNRGKNNTDSSNSEMNPNLNSNEMNPNVNGVNNVEGNYNQKPKRVKSHKWALFLVVSVFVYFGLLFGIALIAPEGTSALPVLILLTPLVPGAFLVGLLMDINDYLKKNKNP